MPIWFELLVLMLVAYVIGLGIGWMLWGRGPDSDNPDSDNPESAPTELKGETN